MRPSQHLAALLPHAAFLDVHDALLRQMRQHPWVDDGSTPGRQRHGVQSIVYCPCPRCDSLDTLRHAVLDWIEGDLWYNRTEASDAP